MVSLLVVGAALAVGTPPASTVNDPARVISGHAQVQVGSEPDAHIRRALLCESQGLAAERKRELTLAVAADPSNVTARGLMGFVPYRGTWKHADDVAVSLQSDDSLKAELAEYNARREGMPDTAEAHWNLAVWCGAHGLGPESRAHLAVVTQLDPSRIEAWERLGYQKYHGRWQTESQIAAEQAETNAQRQADERWAPTLKQWWKNWLALPDQEERAAAQAAIGARLDSRAVPTIHRIFAGGTSEQQSVAVSLFNRIDSAPSTEALVWLAVAAHAPDVRENATDALARRDPNEVIEPLVDYMHDPFRVQVQGGSGRGKVADLWVEGERAVLHKSYTQQTVRVVQTPATAGFGFMGAAFPTGSKRTAAQQLSRDLRRVNQSNERRQALTESARNVLVALTGEDQGSSPDAWRRWVANRRGYAYAPTTTPKRMINRVSRHVQYAVFQSSGYHHNCFAKGTPVRTLLGTQPIETIRAGDQVLAEDTATGALSYQPVVVVYHNPPSPTLRIRFEQEEILSTPIHRFWRAGRGWVLARDLKPGDTVRVLGGVARVVTIEPDQVQPVFNLDVAEGHTYFVGQGGALVHDNTRVDAVPSPFDAPLALALNQGEKDTKAKRNSLLDP